MEIIKLEGDNLQLYHFVAHLVMNEEVLKYNLNYPFRTSSQYRWFIAVSEGDTLGFIPVKLKDGKAIINNYYIADDDADVFSSLLKQIVQEFLFDFDIEAVTQTRHISHFKRNGFSMVLQWTRYIKMTVLKNEK